MWSAYDVEAILLWAVQRLREEAEEQTLRRSAGTVLDDRVGAMIHQVDAYLSGGQQVLPNVKPV